MEQIERIQHMEQRLDQATEAVTALAEALEKYVDALEAIRILGIYLGSNEWRQDLEDDEAGKFPQNLKRGVLSQDGIWNVLTESRLLNIQMREVATEILKNQ